MIKVNFNLRNAAKMLVTALAATTMFSACDKDDPKPNGNDNGTPAAVVNLDATPGNTQVALAWNAPADNGGSQVTGYEVTLDNWATKVTRTASQRFYTFTGLTNGTPYTFKVRAVNANGTGAESTVTATPTAPVGQLDPALILPEGQAWIMSGAALSGYIFKADGSYGYYWGSQFTLSTEGNWSTNGNKLTITNYSGSKPYTYSVANGTLTMTNAFGDTEIYTQMPIPN
jgi:hypothetical protein